MSIADRRLIRRLGVLLAVVLIAVACAGRSGFATTNPAPTGATVPSPRGTPAPKPEELAMAAFVELVSAADFSFRVTYTGGVGLTTDQLPIEGRTDVVGQDLSTVFTYDFSKEYSDLPDPIKVSVRAVDGKGYMRRDSGKWGTIKVGVAGQTTTLFWAVTGIADLKYLGPAETEAGTLYRISVPRTVLIHPVTIPFNIRSEKVRTTSLEVLIDAKGRPVSGTWKADNQARVGNSGQLQGIAYELRLTFSKLGGDFEIKAP